MSQDDKDPYAMPGGDPFKKKKDALNPSAHDAIFQKGRAGGGGKKKPAPTPVEDDEDLQPYDPPPPPPPQEPPVRLYHPKWSVDTAHFGEKVTLSLDADLPESLKDRTRVIVTVHALAPHGQREAIQSRDLYIKDGKVQGEFDLFRPAKREGKEAESCPYVFTAKHRDSKEIESPRLPVDEKPRGSDELVLELTSSEELKHGGVAFRLQSKDRSIDSKVESKESDEHAGKLRLKFVKLDPNLEYTLDILNSEGKIVDTIFQETLFGAWAEVAK